jgi:hypothetical protein
VSIVRKRWWYALSAGAVATGAVVVSLIATGDSHNSQNIQSIGPTLTNVFYPGQILVANESAWILYSGGMGRNGGVRALQLNNPGKSVTVDSSHLVIPTAMTMFDGSLWIAQSLDGVTGSPDLLRVDPVTDQVQSESIVLGDPVGLVASYGVLYVLNEANGNVATYSTAGISTGGFNIAGVPTEDTSMFGSLRLNALVVVANSYPYFGYVSTVNLNSKETEWSIKVAGSLGPPLEIGTDVYVEVVSSRSTSINEYSLKNGGLIQSTRVAAGGSGESAPSFLDTIDRKLVYGVSGLKELCAIPIDGLRVAECRQLQGVPDDVVVYGSGVYLLESMNGSATNSSRVAVQRVVSLSESFG